jgi:hypothetical protein
MLSSDFIEFRKVRFSAVRGAGSKPAAAKIVRPT